MHGCGLGAIAFPLHSLHASNFCVMVYKARLLMDILSKKGGSHALSPDYFVLLWAKFAVSDVSVPSC